MARDLPSLYGHWSSPGLKNILAVTFFQVKIFPTISKLLIPNTLKIIKTFTFTGKVLHLRWSNVDDALYVSVNDSNQVNVINTKDWFLEREIFQLQHPSGIFIYQATEE